MTSSWVASVADDEPVRPTVAEDAARLEGAARDSFQFIWRTLRRLGVGPDAAVDDAAQRVFEVAASRRESILPGHERAFFFKTALWVAKEARRRAGSAREIPDSDAILEEPDTGDDPEQMLARRRWRRVLDDLLETLPLDLKAVFVLYELEELTMAEIAELLELRAGTVASRLRRARERFHASARRHQSSGIPGGNR